MSRPCGHDWDEEGCRVCAMVERIVVLEALLREARSWAARIEPSRQLADWVRRIDAALGVTENPS